jgi:hypothetical protein
MEDGLEITTKKAEEDEYRDHISGSLSERTK